MFNTITIGPITIYMYGLMMALGFFAALVMCLWRGKRLGLDEDIIWGIFFCAIVGGIAGSRTLFYIVEFRKVMQDISILWDFRNGFVVYGGIIGGVLASWIYCRKKKALFVDYFDLVMPALALAQGIGRIGCLFAGCCYGRETDAWYGIVFHHSDQAPNGVKLIPTQIISAAGDFVICGILLYYAAKKPKRGCVGALYMILYGIGRFALEFLRNDYRGSIGFLSTSQLISLAVVAAGAALFVNAGKKDGAEAEKKSED
ncbi:MAG: prolipoprotein diacylglyceryl transferase [Roseburia sp.]|jgi:phosphatidylglycerol:prolipoprotein diacylglycerol transferase|nr:prolipoprotein diacylglyceryl transferase [Roseburia sp.]